MEIVIGDKQVEVELVSKEGNKVQVTIDGKLYEFDVVMAENGVCSIVREGKSYNAELIRSENGKKYAVNVNFSSFNLDMIDARDKYIRSRRKNGDVEIQNQISSPMPGKIVKVHVAPGDEVKAGDSLLVIEAMKMQSIYKANRDCVVKSVLVKENDTINSDQVLIVLE